MSFLFPFRVVNFLQFAKFKLWNFHEKLPKFNKLMFTLEQYSNKFSWKKESIVSTEPNLLHDLVIQLHFNPIFVLNKIVDPIIYQFQRQYWPLGLECRISERQDLILFWKMQALYRLLTDLKPAIDVRNIKRRLQICRRLTSHTYLIGVVEAVIHEPCYKRRLSHWKQTISLLFSRRVQNIIQPGT